MPPFETFRDAESYAATLAHELTHWTKHEQAPGPRHGPRPHGATKVMPRRNWSPSLARLSSAPTSASPPRFATDHAAYIGHWLKVLKNDKRLIFTAAAHAQRAADYLHGAATASRSRRSGPPHRRPLPGDPPWPCPASSRSTAAAICGAIWWRCASAQAQPRAEQPALFTLREDHRPARRAQRRRALSRAEPVHPAGAAELTPLPCPENGSGGEKARKGENGKEGKQELYNSPYKV